MNITSTKPLICNKRKNKLMAIYFTSFLTWLFIINVNVILAQSTTIAIYPSKDNTIYQRNTSNSNGAGEFFIAGTTGSPYFNRALLQFDIAANIPANAIIENASLTLHVAALSGNSGPNDSFELHRMLQDWGEGVSNAGTQAGQGAPATNDDATWIYSFYPLIFWTGGGNFISSVSASQNISGLGFFTWTSPVMATEIQRWLDSPAGNYGWMLKSNESASFQAKRFSSKENPIVANRPVLTITYSIDTSNIPPQIFIESPVDGTLVNAGTTIHLIANAIDDDGSINKVEFYNNGIKFLEDTVAPFELMSNEAEPGSYQITAKAFDNEGASTISNLVQITVTGCSSLGSITAEGYTNIPGTQVADLTANIAYPLNPSITVALGNLEYSNAGVNYGARLSGYICAPLTGNYIFYIAGDDQAGLFLSTDDNAINKVLIAYNFTPVEFRDWTNQATQKSVPIRLIKGARYYIETLHKQSVGNNHLSVGWVMPDGHAEGPIPANRLSPINSGSSLITNKSFQEAMNNLQISAATKLMVKATPNPSNSFFTLITKSDSDKPLNITVTDVLGRIVERKLNIAANGIVQLGNQLKTGIYFVEVIQGTNKDRLKLVKQ